MSEWLPDLARRKGARYLAIAEALSTDIRTGRLASGARLPTHRDLADALGVTVGTVSRAYAEADRRGLISGEVGRGTFVRGGGARGAGAAPRTGTSPAGPIDLSLNFPMGDIDDRQLAATLTALSARGGLAPLLEYQPHAGSPRHRAAGASWLARAGVSADPDRVLVACGAQHAMAIVFMALAEPGDVVLAEELTYPGAKTLAALLRLDLRAVDIDDAGIVPESFEKACRAGRPRLLYCMPTIQNPTGSVMTEARRRRVAAIAQRHGVAIVEDDIYGMLAPKRPRPMAAFAPEEGFYISSLSKTIAPGLRIAYLLSPKQHVDRLSSVIRSTTWMAAPLMAEIAAVWIEDGTADASLKRKRAEAAHRQALALSILPKDHLDTHPYSYHMWLRLPAPWTSATFVTRAWQRGVMVTSAESFSVGEPAPAAVRLCLGGTRTREDLERGLKILSETLGGSQQPGMSIV